MLTRHVWYACYGSNLRLCRFLCYIRGGRPDGAAAANPGARDKALPVDSRPFALPHRLYFAGRSSRWEHRGVAFVETARGSGRTLSRIYRITREQFLDVFAQENNLPVGSVELDFAELHRAGSLQVERRWYGNCLHIGDVDQTPVYSFTRYVDAPSAQRIAPGERYLKTIMLGLLETYPEIAGKPDLIAYVREAAGGDLNDDLLVQWLRTCERLVSSAAGS